MKSSISAMVVLSFALSLALAQKDDMESQIKRARKELMQLQTERQKNRLDMAKDVSKFKEYTKRAAARQAAVIDETVTIEKQIKEQQRKNYGLAAKINSANARVKQIEMSQDELRKQLAQSCDRIIADLNNFAPMVRQKLIASTALLKSELRNKSVDNVEALNRMIQVLNHAEEVTGSIQTSQEKSPITEIRGTVYRLRVGSFFEAVVNMNGDECAVWYGADNKGWKTIKDPAVATQILKAATIREGKTIPEFVTLPLVAGAEKGGAK
jgi:hypothetical protein